MSLADLPELISKGESVSACLSLYKEMQATEREERAAERRRISELSVGQYIIKQNISKIKYFTRKKLSEKK
jgi:hypothetical protein